MGVCLEWPNTVLGLQRFEQHVERTQPEGVRSGPGDLDRVTYSMRKFCSLALKGNPSILHLLFLPEYLTLHEEFGRPLIQHRSMFWSKKAGKAFKGYLEAQRMRLEGRRGGKDVNRPELVKKYEFDTKFAYHMLRLGIQGMQYLETGQIQVPMLEEHREFLLAVRQGKVPKEECCRLANLYANHLQFLMDGDTTIPDEPNYEATNNLLIALHREFWRKCY